MENGINLEETEEKKLKKKLENGREKKHHGVRKWQ